MPSVEPDGHPAYKEPPERDQERKMRSGLSSDKDGVVRFHGKKVPPQPRVSIVTPCFNGLPYVKQAVASVEQIAEHVPLEHVVADGGSSDGTVEVLSEAGWVTGQSASDDGLYDALNWAITEAKGDYIQWMNADDELSADFVRAAVDLLDREPDVDIVLGQTLFVDERGEPKERWKYDLEAAFDLGKQARGYFFNLNSSLIRASTLQKVGQFNQQAYPIGADLDLQLSMIAAKVRPAILPMTAYRFRVHGGSLTTGDQSNKQMLTDGVRLFGKWAQSSEVQRSTRRLFALRSKQLRFGLGIERLRTRGSRLKGATDLAGFFLSSPSLTLPALYRWTVNKIDSRPPMRDRPT